MLQYNPTVSGSLNITGSLQVSGDITGTVNGINITGLSQSVSSQLVNVQSSTGSSDAKFQTLSGVTSSALTRLTNIESKSASVDISISNINSITASNIARLSNLETKSSSVDISISNINSYTSSNANTSLNTYTGSNDTKFTTLATYTGSLDTKNTTLSSVTSSLISKTGSYATTGSNTFYGTQVFSGSVYVANDLIVQGSSSIQYISASSVSIGTNIVQLNTANPSVRFAGLTIIDSGSIGGSGSFLYDSVHDEFVFVHRGNGTNVTSSHFVLGPETYDSLGNETYLTCNIISKGTGKEHLIDSCIFDNGTTTCIKNNLIGTGTISGTTIYGSTAVCSTVGTFSGCVGIGITNPSANLDINATGGLGGWTGIRLKTGTSIVQSLSMGQVTAGNGAWIGMAQYNQGGYWQTEGTAAAVLNFESDGVFRISTNSGLTANTNYNITERLRITSGGNIGINCTTPNYKLHVNGCTAIDGNLRMGSGYSSGNSTDPGITVQGYSNAGVYFSNCGVGLGAGSSSNLLFLSCIGNVGIGTCSPINKLETNIGTTACGGYNLAFNASTVASSWRVVNPNVDNTTQFGTINNNDLAFITVNTERMRIAIGGNVGLSTVAPASLLSAYNTTSTAISQMYISNPASNGTGGGNRGFDTSFTSTLTSFTGTDNGDQGYGYFPLTIINGQTYTIHFKSTAVNGTLGTIITSTGTNFATDSVQTISLPTITDGALTSIRFTATGAATYIGFAGYRTSGTMSLTISEVSIVSGIPDIETGAIVAYKGIATNRINIQAPTTACIPALGCADCTTGLIISNFDTRYGMLLGSLNTGTGWIQQGRFDGTATSYPLSLNPNGGKVGIGATSPNWLLEICCNTTATGGGGYPAISINNPNDAGYSAYYFFKGAGNMGGMEVSNATCGLLLNTLCTLNFQTNNNTRIRICNTGESYFTCKPYFPGVSLTCTYTCTFASYTAGTWIGLFAGDNGYNGAYAFTVVGQLNLAGSALYSMNYSTVPYIHSSTSIGSTNGTDIYGVAHTSSGHADNGALVCFRRARYSGNSPAGNRTEFCMNVSYTTSFTATTYVLAWV